jgi:hypothetical protein
MQLARCQIQRDDEYDMKGGSEASRLTKFVPSPAWIFVPRMIEACRLLGLV